MFKTLRTVFVCVAGVVVLSSCDRAETTSPEASPAGGALAFRLSESEVGALAPQADSIRVSVSRTGQPTRAISAALDGWIQIDSLPVGNWELEVAVYQAGGNLTWMGKAGVQVVGGRTVDAVVHLAKATGNVHVQVVIDSMPNCTTAVGRVDTVHVTTLGNINSRSRIVRVVSEPGAIRIVVRSSSTSPVPQVLLVQGADGTSLTVGDPFFECGGITGPCPVTGTDSIVLRTILVPWSEVPSCAGPVTVIGESTRTPVSRPGGICTGDDPISLVWSVQGGFAGGGTGEFLRLTRSGVLSRALRDSSGRLDSTNGKIPASILAYADSILARPDVLGLPGPEDTVSDGRVFDGFYEVFEIHPRNGDPLKTFGVEGRICWERGAFGAVDSLGQVRLAAEVPCPSSSGSRALSQLIQTLRTVPLVLIRARNPILTARR